MLEIKKKQSVIKKFQTHEGDTGSSEVQIAILTAEIDELVEHLKKHPKDYSSRRGLLRKVSSRRCLMRFLKKENQESYDGLTKKLKIKQPRVIAQTSAVDSRDAEDELLSDVGEESKETEHESDK